MESFPCNVRIQKGDPSKMSKYRPLALTCIACKIKKTIIKDLLIDHLNLNNFISKNQHVFLPRHSTSLQLLECVNYWTQTIENSKCVDICYIDCKRAF